MTEDEKIEAIRKRHKACQNTTEDIHGAGTYTCEEILFLLNIIDWLKGVKND